MNKLLLLLLCALLCPNFAYAQGDDAARVLALINQTRANANLAPLALNAQLTTAAQAHAEDMVKNGTRLGHRGSDGSTAPVRILRAGYRAYSWGPVVGENWAAYQTIDASMAAWMSDAQHRDNILRLSFREVGIGIAYFPSHVPVLVTDFGAQPNVLPVFLSGNGASVNLRLANEEAAPDGDGAQIMGRAVRVEISTYADFSQARAMPFVNSIQFSLPDGQDASTVYVRYSDAQGRTIVSTTGRPTNMIAPVSVLTRTPTPKPTWAKTRTPRPTATRTLTRTLTALPTLTPTATETLRVRKMLAASLPAEAEMRAGEQESFSLVLPILLIVMSLSVGIAAWWRWKG